MEKDTQTLAEDIIDAEVSRIVLRAVDSIIEETNELKDKQSGIVFYPEYSDPIIICGSRWRIANPITLGVWTSVSNVPGVYLERGFYKIQYDISGTSKQTNGLAIFEQITNRIRNLLAFQCYVTDIDRTITTIGEKYVELKTPGILSITNEHADINPADFWGKVIVNLFKLETNPQ